MQMGLTRDKNVCCLFNIYTSSILLKDSLAKCLEIAQTGKRTTLFLSQWPEQDVRRQHARYPASRYTTAIAWIKEALPCSQLPRSPSIPCAPCAP